MQKMILVVDDDVAVRNVCARFLQSIGHKYEMCVDVISAKKALAEKNYDLLITDLRMPGDSGVELIRHAKSLYPTLGIVVMTGHGTPEMEDEIVELGVEGYIIKPLSRDALLITVKNALKQTDLTKERIAYEFELEEIIKQRTGKLQAILDNLSAGLVLIDKNLTILEINRKMREWFPGITLSDTTKCYRELIKSERPQKCDECPVELALKTGKTQEMACRRVTAEGVKDFRIVSTPILDSNGQPYAAIALYDDMTERMLLERELRQAQNLESVGQLAAGIAHEINTPIQYISDNINFLKDAITDITMVLDAYEQSWAEFSKTEKIPEEIINKLEQVKEDADLELLWEEIPNTIQDSLHGVNQVTKIVRAIKDFSHPGEEERSSADLNEILESTITVCRNEWKYHAKMEKEFSPDLPAILCFPGDLGRVFLNIIVNAAHAIEKAAGNQQGGLGKIIVRTQKTAFGVQVQISDTGSGIPEHIRDKVFDPFFTTKERGKGTGQGLAIAYRVIVDKHLGKIRFDSEEGVGTTFTIDLPMECLPAKGDRLD
ncbi:ATP-binding protein [Desulfogranum japonicum]|uniref:ATP-binding protein n=1 Tax=Desulfogranum japonicum TaxID=231447 RepID=UPI00040302A2|nr:ATP-binding protein [Desulfogranum japonicum]